ncbi:class I fructose-bisphosphate aldolase [Trinickia caryophylli]|uniref:Probable fructose-bisphosphate aldolase class 1 n=1 Tax=Trinickia caryophylli TaxID=28094 RepID=A0A1X7FK57_TRICW|nr:class I fructose-bisphosphate aldolase [Trinickia caryophylli]PMS13155.1 fructose-bisphosphate aldolase class I [Trinickia caryophylli]TRX19319.1 fructose-bisphosphate aldolase class I [Trinickia caryophylli]WQE13379.1 class I fructose-bisphosphate aldolase [Trinickia caryophylli]SMF53689.1 fructose-bisphosphate aldolase [Trinickia caryophylli]GLU34103.1 fructose-bisphosphate aldolase [Trinickia caryophylli]
MNTQSSEFSELQATIDAIAQPGKGLLAADESSPTIAKRFKTIGVESTEENRRAWRTLLLGTAGLGEFVSGIILYEETLGQCADDGEPLPQLAARQGIVPGIKVDKGKIALAHASGDEITEGLDGLGERLQRYKQQGARFAKWRAVYNVSDTLPSRLAMEANAEGLARYAAICQEAGIVPIVEPEVLMDGDHSIERCAQVTEAVLHEVFHALHRHAVVLEHMLLKPSMVVAGKEHARQASVTAAAASTVTVLGRTVPPGVAGIFFLSGGQTPEEATAHLDAINRTGRRPWPLSFSYGRALQEPPLKVWRGQPGNVKAAQQALLMRARLNSAASLGRYDPEDETRGR